MALVSELITRAKQRADMENSNFIGSAEAISFVANSYYALYDILVGKFEDYYSSSTTFTLSGTNSYALPAAVYKVRGVDRDRGSSEYYPLKPFSFHDREGMTAATVDGTYKLWYIPTPTAITTSSQTISDVLHWDEYIVLDAARKMLLKEESDVSGVLMELAELSKRIEAMAAGRDAGSPSVISDTRDRVKYENDIRYCLMGGNLLFTAFDARRSPWWG